MPDQQRLVYKVCVLVDRGLHQAASIYLAEICTQVFNICQSKSSPFCSAWRFSSTYVCPAVTRWWSIQTLYAQSFTT